jgi:hypothetical protein
VNVQGSCAALDQTPRERRIVVSGIVFLMLLPIVLAVAGASDGQALAARRQNASKRDH